MGGHCIIGTERCTCDCDYLLASAIAAFVLYSVLARATEILLVVAILHKSIEMHVFLHAYETHTNVPEHSILSSTHDNEAFSNSNKAAPTSNAPPLPSRRMPSFRSLGPQQGISMDSIHNNTHSKAPPSCSDLFEQSVVERTVWNKKWSWVVTPSNDIAVQVAEHVYSNDSVLLHSQPLQAVPAGDSGSEDSTDSSGTYFV